MTSTEAFLLGTLTAMSLTVAVFFLRFWRDTRDVFFLAFSASFVMEALSRALLLFAQQPNRPSLVIHLIRILASLLILWAILQKNYGRRR